MSNTDKINHTITTYKSELEALDKKYIGETIGIAQALNDIWQALDEINETLSCREYEKTAQLGYGDIGSAYIFLQRTLGGLQDLENQKQSLISEIAMNAGVPVYEEVAPFVEARLETSKVNIGGKK